MTLPEKIKLVMANPIGQYQKILKGECCADRDNIEDLLCFFYAASFQMGEEEYTLLSGKILEHERFNDNPLFKYYFFTSKGMFYRRLFQYEQSLSFFENANKVSYLLNDPLFAIKSLANIAISYNKLEKFDTALFYCEKAIHSLHDRSDKGLIADLFNMTGYILHLLRRHEESVISFQKALDFYNQAYKDKAHINLCIIYMNLSEVFESLGRETESKDYFKKAMKMGEDEGYLEYMDNFAFAISDYYVQNNEKERAIDFLKTHIGKLKDSLTISQKERSETDSKKLKDDLSVLESLKKENTALQAHMSQLYQLLGEQSEKSSEKNLFVSFSKAMKNNEILPHYQARWSLREGEFTGVEALVRWIREDGSIIYPDSFIDLIEGSDLVFSMSTHIMTRSMGECRKFIESAGRDFCLSLNISPHQLVHQDVAFLIKKLTLMSGLSPKNIEVEITERSYLDQNPVVMNQLVELKEAGVKLALDDFGTGFTSLSILNQIPFDTVKIDRSLLLSAMESEKGRSMLSGAISLLHDMKYHTVCEGVETEEQLKMLKDMGCDEVQGYYFSKVLSFEDMSELLKQ